MSNKNVLSSEIQVFIVVLPAVGFATSGWVVGKLSPSKQELIGMSSGRKAASQAAHEEGISAVLDAAGLTGDDWRQECNVQSIVDG